MSGTWLTSSATPLDVSVHTQMEHGEATYLVEKSPGTLLTILLIMGHIRAPLTERHLGMNLCRWRG